MSLVSIPEDKRTYWERVYSSKHPYHFYKLRSEWTPIERDFMAYWNKVQQDLLDELGHPSALPIVEIRRWMDPVVRDGADMSTAKSQWSDYDVDTFAAYVQLSFGEMEDLRECGVDYHLTYANAYAEAWDALSQAEQDAVRGLNDDQKQDRESFEAMTPDQRQEMQFDHKCQEIAFWSAEQPNTDHEARWFQALAALGPDAIDAASEVLDADAVDRLKAARPMEAHEAEQYCKRFKRSRWQWVALKLRSQAPLDPPAETTQSDTPSVETPRSDTPPAETSQIAPHHVDDFCEWLMRERDLMAKENGSSHSAIKHRVYESYVEDVRSGEPVHSQIMFNYDQFLGWLRGDYGQRTAKETTLWADGTEDDHTQLSFDEAAYKAEQDAYADEVKQYQTLLASGDPDTQQGFDEWRRPNRDMFPFNGTYVEDSRTGCYIAYDQVADQRDELDDTNVRYRLSRHPDGTVQISWLALNYESCLCFLPHSTETETRMVEAEEVPDLIVDCWRVLTPQEYADNQKFLQATDDRFVSFKLWVQYSPDGVALGICPTQSDSGPWTHNSDLFDAILAAHSAPAAAPVSAANTTQPVEAPADVAAAIAAGDWAEVARLAAMMAGT